VKPAAARENPEAPLRDFRRERRCRRGTPPENRRSRILNAHSIGYRFCRGSRLPEQIAVARSLFGADGVIPFDDTLAAHAAEIFRRLGSPRRRAADIAIGVTAAATATILLTRNARDFAGIPDLELEIVS
jgi:hypothetical protein